MKKRTLSPPDSPLLTILDVCHLLGISQRTAWLWVDLGKLPQPVRPSRRCVRWRRADLAGLLAQAPAAAGGAR